MMLLFGSLLPEVCQVNCSELHDVLLEEDYEDLPNLMCVLELCCLSFPLILPQSAGSFRSWSSASGSGYVWFSGWALQTPTLDLE